MEKTSVHEKPTVVVIMVPFPAQGHLNQLLHLSRLISDHAVPVHYVGSATHNRQAKIRVQGWNPETISTIHFHDLPLPPFSTPPPNPNSPIKFPDHLQPTFDATAHLRKPLADLFKTLCTASQRVAIIHDSLMSFAAQESDNYTNAEAFAFHSVSAYAYLSFEWEALGGHSDKHLKVSDLPPLSSEGCFSNRFMEFMARQLPMMASCTGHIYNTCRTLEGDYLNILAHENVWAIGPMNPIVLGYGDSDSHARHTCLEWLDKQPEKSALYISFGTNTAISDEQITELATGLERSGQRFIWVVREADRGDIFSQVESEMKGSEVDEEYEKKIRGRGVIVRDWAPQLEILAHPSTGGFLSHCGWNSCIESMSMGVPIAAWPMHSDQPRNAMLVTDVLRIGVTVREWIRREEIVSAADVEGSVRKLMVSEEGKNVGRRAEELGVGIREAWLDGGCSHAELHSFIAHISRAV
ncbi:zeatin O-glucosyltransferase-like [Magnolia sinica]|uniref:zeatin O-glucosyltransferase-like n=1 Tax=Magnolia sinica TaxID=86752 RepID=UPI00265A51E0|nr:zeatin O-glucosyltransferase-like [Magnolia sinica]